MTSPTARILHDGDVLPMVGGPLDGVEREVRFVFPFLNGGLAPSGWSFTISDNTHFYTLDTAQRQWTYQEPTHA